MINKSESKTYTLSKLQMYDECPQKYKLCYIDKVHVIEKLQIQKASKTGNNLHNIINFYLKGMDVSKLISSLSQAEKVLWHNFKNSEIKDLNYINSEYSFNVRIDEYWLTGRIDALFESSGNYIILDWKTGDSFRPENVKFQTTFYLVCMYEILKSKNYIKEPQQLSLHYMDLNTGSTVKINFNEELYTNYKAEILEIINKINNNTSYFCNKTDNCKHCKYYRVCPYL